MAWDDDPPTIEELKKKMPAAVATVAWDAEPPKPEELAGGPSVMSKLGEFAGNVGENALDLLNLKKQGMGLLNTFKEGAYDIPLDLAKTSVGVVKAGAKAIAGKAGLGDVVKSVTESPIVKRTRAMTEPIAKNPGKFAFERPLDAASLLLAPIAPFLGRGAAAKAALGAEGSTAEVAAGPGLGRRMVAKTISTTLGAPEEAVLSRMENPAGVKTAFSHSELADQMVNSVKNLGDSIGELDKGARETLRSSPFIEDGAIPKSQIKQAIQGARRDLGGVFSEEAQKASGTLKRVVQRFNKLRNTVSEQQVKDLIQQLDADIDWNNPAASKTNEALVGVRTRLDGVLKKQNPHYADAMKPVSNAVKVMDEVQRKFGIERKTGQGFQPSDQTPNRIRTALKEERVATKALLDKFQKITGEDWESKIKNANVSEAFRGEKTQGSRRAVIGGTVGGGVGYAMGLPPWMTSAIGTVAGAFADIYGRRVAGVLSDALSVPEMRRYVPALQRAAVRGSRALAIVHANFIERDPDYTAAMSSAINGHLSANNGGKR